MERKILISLIIVIALCINSQSVSVLAANAKTESVVTVVEYSNSEDSDTSVFENKVDRLTNKIETRAETPPIKGWDLSKEVYRYSLDNVTDYTITNYAFKPDANGCISISTNGINTNGGNITITLKWSGTFFEHVIQDWTGDPQSIQGLGFNGLDPNKYYYFHFTVSNGVTANGGGIIHHP